LQSSYNIGIGFQVWKTNWLLQKGLWSWLLELSLPSRVVVVVVIVVVAVVVGTVSLVS
jgi:hypothetical protein